MLTAGLPYGCLCHLSVRNDVKLLVANDVDTALFMTGLWISPAMGTAMGQPVIMNVVNDMEAIPSEMTLNYSRPMMWAWMALFMIGLWISPAMGTAMDTACYNQCCG